MRVVLAHGASGTAASMQTFVDALRRRDVEAMAIDLPKRRAEDAVPAYRAALEGAGLDIARTVIGGQSYGGRVASLLAVDEPPAGLVLFCYPLHPPGRPRVETRADHFPLIRCPVLLLSGDADPLARTELLRSTVERLPDAELVVFPGVGHSLKPVLEEAMARVADFVDGLGRSAE